MTKFSEVAHLYTGCLVMYVGMKNPKVLTGRWLNSLLEKGIMGNIKPILHPLSSMTDGERDEYNKVYRQAYKTRTLDIVNAATTNYLLSKHFDLFNLIGNNEAIDIKEINCK